MQVIATAGHVDHGKSSLVRALTGMEPDRWAEERRRGLTIDLGFAWLTWPDGQRLAFVDVPGHERFVPNMLAGLGPVPAILFVVAADGGWMPQSAEHLAAVDALGISRGLLAVTRADLADPGPALHQARELIARSSLGQVPAVAVSARTGQGLDSLRAALATLAAALPTPDPGAPVRLWVDRVFSRPGSGTIVTGTLPAGTVRVGDDLLVTPGERLVRVRAIETLGERVAAASGVTRVALNLRGVAAGDLVRGMALTIPGGWALTSTLDVRLARPADGPARGSRAPEGSSSPGPAPNGLMWASSAQGSSAQNSPASGDPVPDGPAPDGSASGDPVPGDPVPGDPVPVGSASGDPVLGGSASVAPAPAGDAAGSAGRERLPRLVTVHAGSARVRARVRPFGGGFARLTLEHPLPLHVADRLLLRDPGAARVTSRAHPVAGPPDGAAWPGPVTPQTAGASLPPSAPAAQASRPSPVYAATGPPDFTAWPGVWGAIVLDTAPPAPPRRGAAAVVRAELASWPSPPTAADLLRRHGLLREAELRTMGLSGSANAGPADTGTADAGRADAGTADTGRADAGTADTGRADAGPGLAGWFVDPAHRAALAARLARAVAEHAAREPLAAGMPLEAARAAAGLPDRKLTEILAADPAATVDGRTLLTEAGRVRLTPSPAGQPAVSPASPAAPAAPTSSAGPAAPTTPAGPASPTTPAGPTSPTSSAGLATPTTPAGPVSPTTPAGPASPTAPVGPALSSGPALPAALTEAVKQVLADLADAPFHAPEANRLRELSLDRKSLAAAARAGLLLRITPEIVLAPGAAAQAATILATLPQPFTTAQARQALATSRRVAIPLLEHLDRSGVTRRLPDDRRTLHPRADQASG